MDLSNFKLLKEADDSYEIGHPSGKKLTVSKSGLSEKAKAAIKKYACGGEVEMYKSGGMVDGGSGGDEDPVPAAAPSESDLWSNAAPVPANQGEIPMVPSESDLWSNSAPVAPQAAMADVTGQVAAQDPLVQKGISQNSLLDQQQQAAEDLQRGELGSLGQKNQALNSFQNDEAKEAADFQQRTADFRTKDAALEKAYMDHKIDPDRYWKNQSTGSKIAAGIGLLFSGFGSSLSHGPNIALGMLNQAIDADIDAQKSDQSKAQNLWKMNKEAYGDDRAAHLATQNQLLTGLQAKIQQAGIGAQSAEAKFKVQQAIGDIQEKKLHNNMLLGQLSETGNASSGGGGIKTDPALLVPEFIKDPAQQKVAYDEIQRAQNMVKNRGKMEELFKTASSGSTSGGGQTVLGKITHLGFDAPALKALKGLVATQLKGLDGTAREFAMKNAEENFLPAAGDRQATIDTKAEAFKNWLDSEQEAPTVKGASGGAIDLAKFASTQPAGDAQFAVQNQTMNGIPYKKVAGGWQKVSK